MSAFQGFDFVNRAGQMMRSGVANTQAMISGQYRQHMEEYNRKYERLADVRRRVFDPTMQKMVGDIYDVSIGNVLKTAIEEQNLRRNTSLALQEMDAQDVLQERGAARAREFGPVLQLSHIHI